MFGLRTKKVCAGCSTKLDVFTLENEYSKRIGETGKVSAPSGTAPTGAFFCKDFIEQ